MMLRHVQLPSFADRIEDAITTTLAVRGPRGLISQHMYWGMRCMVVIGCSHVWKRGVCAWGRPCRLVVGPSHTHTFPPPPPCLPFQDKRNWTKDVGGTASTSQFVDAIVAKL